MSDGPKTDHTSEAPKITTDTAGVAAQVAADIAKAPKAAAGVPLVNSAAAATPAASSGGATSGSGGASPMSLGGWKK